MPFLSPLWARGPRIVFLHHMHGSMWRTVLPPRLARMGEVMEQQVAPPIYRGTRIVTLSDSSRAELIEQLGFDPARVDVVPPGIDPRFRPGPARSDVPMVVAVGRLVPVKRFDVLIQAMADVRKRHPQARLVIVGEGYERADLDRLVEDLDAADWIEFAGRVDDETLVSLYQQAWAVASASTHEGWGMTLTEAAACGTPAVATRIPGHLDAVSEGKSGLLADTGRELERQLEEVLADAALRTRLQEGALAHAAQFSWERTAFGTLQALASEARRSRR
jgi:glycosyltransferase involved in cell wall biosynthesis